MKVMDLVVSVQSLSMHVMKTEQENFREWLRTQAVTGERKNPRYISPEEEWYILKWIDSELVNDDETKMCIAGLKKLRGKHIFADAACISWDWE